jgi:hypothetical protein
MVIERKVKLAILLILNHLATDYDGWDSVLNDYDRGKMDSDLFNLLDEFLIDYALNKPEKSV